MKALISFYIFLCLAAAGLSLAFIHFPGHFAYDEGVYLLSLKALRSGAKLFDEIYYSQLPLFIRSLDWLSPGPVVSVSGVRWVIWSQFPLFLGSIGWVGYRLFGRAGAAVAMLAAALDPAVFGLSHVVNGNIPAIAWATLAWALALEAGRKDKANLWLLLSAGALAIGIQLKALVLPAIVPVAVSFLELNRIKVSVKKLAAFSLALGAASVILLLLTGYEFSYLSQLQGGAVAKSALKSQPLWERIIHLWNYVAQVPYGYIGDDADFTYWPLFLLASGAIFFSFARERNRPWLLVGCWWAVSAFALTAHQPVWHHHLLLISPALALGLGGLGAAALSAPHGARRFAMMFVLAFTLLFSLKSTLQPALTIGEARAEWMRDMHPVVQHLQEKTEENGIVLSDEPYFTVAAGRRTFPIIVDPSRVRIRTGSISCEAMDKMLTHPDTKAVVVEGRFRSLDCGEPFERKAHALFPAVKKFVNEVSVFTRR